jgi:hypothetical protein
MGKPKESTVAGGDVSAARIDARAAAPPAEPGE